MTPSKNQTAIINYFKASLENLGVKIISNSRGGKHLRISYSGNVPELLNKIVKCRLSVSKLQASSSYETQEIEILQNIPGASAGDKILFVNNVNEKTGSISKKELTPNNLRLGGKIIKKNVFYNTIISEIDKLKHSDLIKEFLKDVLESSGSSDTKLKTKYMGVISNSDLNTIAQDFGEISGAYWFMCTHPEVTAIEFPASSNFALVDYFAHTKNAKIAISAKANDGAPPSIEAIARVIKKMKFTKKEEIEAQKAIINIAESSTLDGIINASKSINSDGYLWLKKNLFNNKDFTPNDCEDCLKGLINVDAVKATLGPFYAIIGRSASAAAMNKIIGNKSAKRRGLILSPLGYNLVDILNKNQDYKNALNAAAKTIVVTQLYMSFNKSQNKIDYVTKEFRESNFDFFYNSNANIPNLKKISFKMKK